MTVKFKIDGVPVEAEQGSTVLDAAHKVGIDIPTLCYHKALTPYGACRLCVVQIEKAGRTVVQTSCLYPVDNDLEVTTRTPQIDTIRRTMVELLLTRAPDAKPVREVAAKLGVTGSRFVEKREDCILCGMCIRMCKERICRSAIGFAERGELRKIAPPFDVFSPACMVCGACHFVCPTAQEKLKKVNEKPARPILDEFDERLRSRPAIRIPFPQAVPNLAVIDKERCVHFLTDNCRVCEEFCEPGAIKFDQQEQTVSLQVGSVILSPGFDEYEAGRNHQYGYGRFANVVTSIEFERILSASGPYEGHLRRPGDLKEPKRVAFIQCVGSRDPHSEREYCSSVCCMYATKEAVIAKEHAGRDLNTTIFYMDIRAHGKDFDRYYERAEKEYGVRYVRSRVANIEEDPETKNLKVKYETDGGKLTAEEFDLVVLSVGLSPGKNVEQLARRLGFELNSSRFCKTDELAPVQSSKPGVFVAGALQGPKDIPETVTQASAAAGLAGSLLAPARSNLVIPKEYPPEMAVAGEPRIGVFVCHCGINIGGFVKVSEVVAYAKTLPGVAYVGENLYTCSQDTQQTIKEKIKEFGLNRVIVASCTPRTHEPLFQETIREVGLNRHLFEMANIRDQCSWIHMQDREGATDKANDLVRMAVAKAALIEPLQAQSLPIVAKAFVIGGGLAGMVAARTIADQGKEVFIVEREDRLGGNLNNIYYTLEGRDVQAYREGLIGEIERHPGITVFRNSEIEEIKGYVGNYKTKVKDRSGGRTEVEHGVFVVATGAAEWRPDEYLYARSPNVVTQLELERMIATADPRLAAVKTVVMVQCVGSRDPKRPYCSRICCTDAIKNSLLLKARNPATQVYVLYRDIRTYGFKERFYEQAREQGVIFIRYETDDKPLVSREGNQLHVLVSDLLLGEKLAIDPDLLVLSAATVPRSDNRDLAKLLKVPVNEDGFFLEAHVKLRPVDFATEGVFLAGMAHSPKSIEEAVGQAQAAAGRAMVILSKDTYTGEAIVATVNDELCAGCGICTSICEYKAPSLVVETIDGHEVRKSTVNEALCKGCGTCAAACPSGAMEQLGFKKEQLAAMVDACLEDRAGVNLDTADHPVEP